MLKILLIDDSPDYRQLLITRLQRELPHAQVDEYDPAHGLPDADFFWSDYNLVLLDIDLGLSNANGLDWLDELRRHPAVPPIIIMTGEDDSQVAVNALKRGAEDYLLKNDINDSQLVIKLMDALEQETLDIGAPPTESPEDAANSTFGTQVPDENTLPNQPPDFTEETGSTTYQNVAAPEPVSESESNPALQLEIPGYRNIREIGRGGMSVVILAERLEDNVHVVLKILFTDAMHDKTALKRFMEEYNLLSNVSHPHVVRIYERAFAAEFAYIAMQYFSAGDLSKRIRAGIRPAEALEYLRQMASGLAAVHELNIVHRDIKPGNILFKEDGSLTITDFGVAKQVAEDSDDMEDITINNMVIGTPYYISPEQGSGMPVDQRSDLYSLGVIFYQMLTGRRPFTGNSISELLQAHISSEIPRLPDYLVKYQPLIDGLLAKDPDERFQTARELLIGIDWKR
ncbi:MAG: protein kinase [Gammaproteobacteria bacterium]